MSTIGRKIHRSRDWTADTDICRYSRRLRRANTGKSLTPVHRAERRRTRQAMKILANHPE